jgi:peptidyl-prolyl cis-trans isomerase SurA
LALPLGKTELVAAPNGGNPGDIPNEDSLDFELNDTNLFRLSRFTGLDRVSSGSRIDYGIGYSLYDARGNQGAAFIGQSYLFEDKSPYEAGSGHEEQLSDIVGSLSFESEYGVDFYYRFRLDKDDGKFRRNEVGLEAGPAALNLKLTYAKVQGLVTEDEVIEDREELNWRLSSQLTENWRIFGGSRQDFETDNTLEAHLGIGYEDECFVDRPARLLHGSRNQGGGQHLPEGGLQAPGRRRRETLTGTIAHGTGLFPRLFSPSANPIVCESHGAVPRFCRRHLSVKVLSGMTFQLVLDLMLGRVVRRGIFAGLVLALLALPQPVFAQSQLRPAAVVNDEAISALDLSMRVRIAMVSAKLEDTPEVRERMAAQAIRSLVDERLRAQEAARLGYDIGEEDIARAVGQIASRNNLSVDAFWSVLEGNGILTEAFRDQIGAELLWQKIVQRHLKPQIQITEDEVEGVVERIVASSGNMQWQLAEIFLAVDTVLDRDRVLQNARRIREALGRGANFQSLAQQASDSAAAARGGDLGWIQQGQLDENIEQALRQARPGVVVGPLESLTGFHFFLVRDMKRIADAGTEVHLNQLLFSVEPDAGEEAQQDARTRALELRNELESCEDLREQAEELGSGSSADLGRLKLGDMPPELRSVVASLRTLRGRGRPPGHPAAAGERAPGRARAALHARSAPQRQHRYPHVIRANELQGYGKGPAACGDHGRTRRYRRRDPAPGLADFSWPATDATRPSRPLLRH